MKTEGNLKAGKLLFWNLPPVFLYSKAINTMFGAAEYCLTGRTAAISGKLSLRLNMAGIIAPLPGLISNE
jgi:hypothetical protein